MKFPHMYGTVPCSDATVAAIPCVKILSTSSNAVVSTVPLTSELVVYQQGHMTKYYNGGNMATS